MVDPRTRLKQLLALARASVGNERLWEQIQRMFNDANEPISWITYKSWCEGKAFPATQYRQNLLGRAVGGKIGDGIKQIPAPRFRGWRSYYGKEHKTVKRSARGFKMVSKRDESGKLHWQAEITCCECGATFHHIRNGSLDDDIYFTNKGWMVGKSDQTDHCPNCVTKRKVVHMSDHKKPEGNGKPVAAEPKAEAVPVMGKLESRLLIKAIEQHWDDNAERYQVGWSDAKLAEREGVPVEWVKQVREQLYGGYGEDPVLHEFIAEQTVLKQDIADLKKTMSELSSSATYVKGVLDKHERLMESYRDKLAKVASKEHKLQEAADKLNPFAKAG